MTPDTATITAWHDTDPKCAKSRQWVITVVRRPFVDYHRFPTREERDARLAQLQEHTP